MTITDMPQTPDTSARFSHPLGRASDAPEKEDALVDQALPEVREQAAGHAAACEQAPAPPPDHGSGTAGTGCPF